MTTYQSGDYCCVTVTGTGLSNTICDDAIHFFTKSDFAHAFIVTNASTGEIVEATPHKGVAYANIEKYAPYTKIFSNTILTQKQRDGIIASAAAQVGRTSYGFLDILYLGMYTQGVKWNWLESEVLEENKQTICSQSVARCGLENGVNSWLCGQSHPNLVWPGALANLAMGQTDGALQKLSKSQVRRLDTFALA